MSLADGEAEPRASVGHAFAPASITPRVGADASADSSQPS
jgi:hypothetical protein